MVDVSLIKEHLEAVGSDGGHVGRVDHVLGDQIELAKLDLAGGFQTPYDPGQLGFAGR